MRPTNLPKPARVGGLALAALVLVGAGVFYVLDDGSEKAPRVELVATRRGTVTAAVSAAGNTVDERTRELAFGGSGTVKKVYVRAGDKVRRGEVLATIGSAPARERYTAAKAQLAAAQEALDNAETQSASPTPATQGQSSGQSQGQSQAQGQGSQAQGQGQPGGAQCPPTAQTPPPGGTATPNPSPGRSRTAEPDRTLVPGGTSTPTPAVPDITPTAAPSGGAGRMGAVVPAGYLVKTGPTAVPTPTPTPTVRTKRHGGGSGHPAPEVTVTVTVTATVTVTTTPQVTPTRPGPSTQPTQEPTAKPSGKPSPRPTTKPTAKPTAKPSEKPTAKPGATARPTTCATTGTGNGQGTAGQGVKRGTGQGKTAQLQGGGTRGTGGQGALSVDQAQAQVKRAQAELTDAREELDGVQITAPADGTVMSVAGAVGDEAGTGAFVTLGNLDELQVEALFTESDIGSLKLGQRATITLATREGKKYDGTVTHIAPTATTTGQLVRYGVTIAFDEAPTDLLVGQTATVTVTVAQSQAALYLPAQAVRTKEGVSRVTVQGGGERVVTTGVRSDQYVEITSGLTENDRVVLPTGATTGGFPDGTWPGGLS